MPRGRLGQLKSMPLHPLVVPVPIGAFVSGYVFDLQSQRVGNQYIWARGGYWLVCIGLIGGVIASLFGVADLSHVDRKGVAFRTGVRHLLLMDTVLVWFAACFLWRRSRSFRPPPNWMLAGSLVALIVMAGGMLIGLGLRTRLARGPEPDGDVAAPPAVAAEPTSAP